MDPFDGSSRPTEEEGQAFGENIFADFIEENGLLPYPFLSGMGDFSLPTNEPQQQQQGAVEQKAPVEGSAHSPVNLAQSQTPAVQHATSPQQGVYQEAAQGNDFHHSFSQTTQPVDFASQQPANSFNEGSLPFDQQYQQSSFTPMQQPQYGMNSSYGGNGGPRRASAYDNGPFYQQPQNVPVTPAMSSAGSPSGVFYNMGNPSPAMTSSPGFGQSGAPNFTSRSSYPTPSFTHYNLSQQSRQYQGQPAASIPYQQTPVYTHAQQSALQAQQNFNNQQAFNSFGGSTVFDLTRVPYMGMNEIMGSELSECALPPTNQNDQAVTNFAETTNQAAKRPGDINLPDYSTGQSTTHGNKRLKMSSTEGTSSPRKHRQRPLTRPKEEFNGLSSDEEVPISAASQALPPSSTAYIPAGNVYADFPLEMHRPCPRAQVSTRQLRAVFPDRIDQISGKCDLLWWRGFYGWHPWMLDQATVAKLMHPAASGSGPAHAIVDVIRETHGEQAVTMYKNLSPGDARKGCLNPPPGWFPPTRIGVQLDLSQYEALTQQWDKNASKWVGVEAIRRTDCRDVDHFTFNAGMNGRGVVVLASGHQSAPQTSSTSRRSRGSASTVAQPAATRNAGTQTQNGGLSNEAVEQLLAFVRSILGPEESDKIAQFIQDRRI